MFLLNVKKPNQLNKIARKRADMYIHAVQWSTGGTSGAGTHYPSTAPEFIPVLIVFASCCSIFSFLCSTL